MTNIYIYIYIYLYIHINDDDRFDVETAKNQKLLTLLPIISKLHARVTFKPIGESLTECQDKGKTRKREQDYINIYIYIYIYIV